MFLFRLLNVTSVATRIFIEVLQTSALSRKPRVCGTFNVLSIYSTMSSIDLISMGPVRCRAEPVTVSCLHCQSVIPPAAMSLAPPERNDYQSLVTSVHISASQSARDFQSHLFV